MGFLRDTVYDALRPLPANSATLYRDAMGETPIDEEFTEAPSTDGSQTVFRLQKDGGFSPPQAPMRWSGLTPGAGRNDPRVADAGTSQGEPLRAPDMALTGHNASLRDLSWMNGPETGEKFERAMLTNAKVEERTTSSDVPVSALQFDVGVYSATEQQNVLTETMEQSKSSNGVFQRNEGMNQTRWEAGRGAPSEDPSIGAAASFAAESRTLEPSRVFIESSRESSATEPAGPRGSARESSRDTGYVVTNAPRTNAASEPRVRIGRIDVVVVAAAEPKKSAPQSTSDAHFLSRNYLRRL